MAQSVQNAQILNVNSRLALDVTDDGTSATQRAPDPKRESQRWNITLVNEHDSRYLIENVQRGQVLAPVGDWEAAFQPRGGPRQEWRLASLGGDVHQIENPYSSPSRVLEIFSASTDEGATVSQYPNHDGANQRWELTAATSTPSLPGLPEYIQAGGTGWAWGHDANGMLGNGQTIADQPTPVEVSFPRRVAGKAVAVAAFWRHSLAVLENGSVWAWGHGGAGRLGNCQTGDQWAPVEISFPRSVTAKAIAVAAGAHHSLVVLDDGHVWAWGNGANGRLGNGQTGDQWTPVEVLISRSVTAKAIAVAAGEHHSLVVLDDGSVWAWGHGGAGRLGNGQTADQWTPVGVLIPRSATAKALAVAAGWTHSLAALDDGSVWAWGNGANGRLGNGQTADQRTPVEVVFPGSVTAKALAVAAGWAHSLAALDDGSVWAWGFGANGRLGNGQTGEQRTPVRVVFPGSVTAKALAVAAGAHHSLALLDDGSVWAWGHFANGRLGTGQTADQTSPVRVGSFGAAGEAEGIAVAAGELHSLACDGVLRR